MDLAHNIVGAAADQYRQECVKNVCTIALELHGRYAFTIEITPLQQHLLVRYNTLTFRVRRTDTEEMEDTSTFIADEIAESCRAREAEVNDYYKRYEGTDPDPPHPLINGSDEFEPDTTHTISITSHGREVLSKAIKLEQMASELKRYMRQLRLLN